MLDVSAAICSRPVVRCFFPLSAPIVWGGRGGSTQTKMQRGLTAGCAVCSTLVVALQLSCKLVRRQRALLLAARCQTLVLAIMLIQDTIKSTRLDDNGCACVTVIALVWTLLVFAGHLVVARFPKCSAESEANALPSLSMKFQQKARLGLARTMLRCGACCRCRHAQCCFVARVAGVGCRAGQDSQARLCHPKAPKPPLKKKVYDRPSHSSKQL